MQSNMDAPAAIYRVVSDGLFFHRVRIHVIPPGLCVLTGDISELRCQVEFTMMQTPSYYTEDQYGSVVVRLLCGLLVVPARTRTTRCVSSVSALTAVIDVSGIGPRSNRYVRPRLINDYIS
jgi:hypothetical protein